MKILVTGIAGFIASNIASQLIKKGHKVIGIDNLSNGKKNNIWWGEDKRPSNTIFKKNFYLCGIYKHICIYRNWKFVAFHVRIFFNTGKI